MQRLPVFWNVAFISNWKIPDCVHFLVHEPDKPWSVNSRRVRTHEKNSGEAVRRLGTIIQSIFCAQSGASIRLTVWKWFGESRDQGLFRLCLKTFVAPFLPARLTAPGSPRMYGTRKSAKKRKEKKNISSDFFCFKNVSIELKFLLCFKSLNIPFSRVKTWCVLF